MTVEVWKPVPVKGYEHLYSVSNMGRVRAEAKKAGTRTYPQRIINCRPNSDGYPHARLCHKGKRAWKTVHSLVLIAFVGPRPKNHDACHINGDRMDVRLCNLRWDTRRANIEDARKHGTLIVGEKHHASKLTEDDVRAIRASDEAAVRLAPRYGVSDRMIGKIRSGLAWAHVI